MVVETKNDWFIEKFSQSSCSAIYTSWKHFPIRFWVAKKQFIRWEHRWKDLNTWNEFVGSLIVFLSILSLFYLRFKILWCPWSSGSIDCQKWWASMFLVFWNSPLSFNPFLQKNYICRRRFRFSCCFFCCSWCFLQIIEQWIQRDAGLSNRFHPSNSLNWPNLAVIEPKQIHYIIKKSNLTQFGAVSFVWEITFKL